MIIIIIIIIIIICHPRVSTKETEKIDKYLDLTGEQKQMQNMKMTVIPIVISELGTVLNVLENRLVKTGEERKSQPSRSHHC